MGDTQNGDGWGSLPTIVWLPIGLGAIELFGMAKTPGHFWLDVIFSLAIGSLGLVAAWLRGILPAAVRHMVPLYGGAIGGGIALDAMAGLISWWEVLVAAAINAIIYIVVDALIKSGRLVAPTPRRRSGWR